MIGILTYFAIGFIWVGIISINTKIIAHTKTFIPAFGWSIIVSLTYLLVMRSVILENNWIILAGYPLGTATAQGLVNKFWKKVGGKKGA